MAALEHAFRLRTVTPPPGNFAQDPAVVGKPGAVLAAHVHDEPTIEFDPSARRDAWVGVRRFASGGATGGPAPSSRRNGEAIRIARPETRVGAGERERAIVGWTCRGPDSRSLRVKGGTSPLTLGGLRKHLAVVEEEYFTGRMLGREFPPPWSSVDWVADPDWEWRAGAEDAPEELFAPWRSAVPRSRAVLAEPLWKGGLEQLVQFTTRRSETANMRRLLVDMIEECVRHVGHADSIRESVDGLVGEDPTR